MNINAGTNEYNIRLQKIKEEKRPTFATIFDKLDARSKKLTPKNALNAVLTNDQMFRYYLEEVEPQLAGDVDNLDDLQNAIGNNSLGEIKLRDFAKLLSGDLESTKATPIYETLTAGVSYSPIVAPLITPPSIATPPATPASAPSGSGTASAPPATPATPAPAPAPAGGVADGGGYATTKSQNYYNNAINNGKIPPRYPNESDKTKPDFINTFASNNKKWLEYLNNVVIYNKSVPPQYKLDYDVFSGLQRKVIVALFKQNDDKNAPQNVLNEYVKNSNYFKQTIFDPTKGAKLP